MKKVFTSKIEIKVRNITVAGGNYCFDYQIKIDGKTRKGRYDGDYDSQTAEEFKKALENGYAVEEVIQRYF